MQYIYADTVAILNGIPWKRHMRGTNRHSMENYGHGKTDNKITEEAFCEIKLFLIVPERHSPSSRNKIWQAYSLFFIRCILIYIQWNGLWLATYKFRICGRSNSPRLLSVQNNLPEKCFPTHASNNEWYLQFCSPVFQCQLLYSWISTSFFFYIFVQQRTEQLRPSWSRQSSNSTKQKIWFPPWNPLIFLPSLVL